MKSRFDFGFDGGVEVSEGIVAVGIEVALLFDVVLVVLLAYLVDAEQNVDHAHFFSFFWSPPLFFDFLGGIEKAREWIVCGEIEQKKSVRFFGLVGVVPAIVFVCYYLCLEIFGPNVKSSVESGLGKRETKMIFWRVQRPVCPTFPILL